MSKKNTFFDHYIKSRGFSVPPHQINEQNDGKRLKLLSEFKIIFLPYVFLLFSQSSSSIIAHKCIRILFDI